MDGNSSTGFGPLLIPERDRERKRKAREKERKKERETLCV